MQIFNVALGESSMKKGKVYNMWQRIQKVMKTMNAPGCQNRRREEDYYEVADDLIILFS